MRLPDSSLSTGRGARAGRFRPDARRTEEAPGKALFLTMWTTLHGWFVRGMPGAVAPVLDRGSQWSAAAAESTCERREGTRQWEERGRREERKKGLRSAGVEGTVYLDNPAL